MLNKIKLFVVTGRPKILSIVNKVFLFLFAIFISKCISCGIGSIELMEPIELNS